MSFNLAQLLATFHRPHDCIPWFVASGFSFTFEKSYEQFCKTQLAVQIFRFQNFEIDFMQLCCEGGRRNVGSSHPLEWLSISAKGRSQRRSGTRRISCEGNLPQANEIEVNSCRCFGSSVKGLMGWFS